MIIYLPIIIKLGLGILCLIVQINLMGKGNLAPSSAMDQVQNYVLGGIIGGVMRIGAGYRYTGVQLTARKGYAYGQPALRPVCKLQFPVKLGGELRGNGEA